MALEPGTIPTYIYDPTRRQRSQTATTTTQPSTQTGAKASLDAFLATYGLQSLGDFAWNEYVKGVPVEQIMLDLRSTPEWKARFPAMDALAKEGHALSPDQYIAMEQQYQSVMHAYGLPSGFYDSPDDYAKFLIGHVSPTELKDRVAQYTEVVLGDTETLNAMERYYGQTGHTGNPVGDLLAMYLDPDKAVPLLAEQVQSAQFAGAASRSGFGQIDKAQAEQFGAQMNVSAEQAQQGFGALVQNRQLFEALPGQGENQIGQDVQLGAAFGGDAMAQEQIEKRRSERKAAGAGGGQFAQSRTGAAAGLTSNKV